MMKRRQTRNTSTSSSKKVKHGGTRVSSVGHQNNFIEVLPEGPIQVRKASDREAHEQRHLEMSAVRRQELIDLSTFEEPAINEPWQDDVDMMDEVLAGDRPFDISHAGGEFDEILTAELHTDMWASQRRIDHRTRRDRNEQRTQQFNRQMVAMTAAFMTWSLSEAEGMASSTPGPANNGEAEPTYSWSIRVVDTYRVERRDVRINGETAGDGIACNFVKAGLLPCAPLNPTVAITISCVELYRVAHLRCPSLSVQAYIQTLCDLHVVPFRRYLVRQFSIAYDLYLAIRAAARNCALAAVGHDAPDWRLTNCCPACTYVLEDEDEMRFSMLFTMDGGNSLKRVLRRSAAPYDETGETLGPSSEAIDTRSVSGDYYLSRGTVDKFANDIGSAALPESDAASNPCAERWENMAPDITKKMWGVFDETGIFISVCRHGFLLVLADMVKSGELSKYPLAVTKKLLDTFGKDLGGGYDIGCGFATTIAHSSLGPLAAELNYTSLVGAFHGHAHNRRCQLSYLASFVVGLGLEDLEGGERVFSKSNPLARHLRHAGIFHRRQAIVTFFAHSDTFETYQNLGTFLLNNYKQAAEILGSAPTALAKAMDDLGITEASAFETWRQEEKTYLDNLATEPLIETLEMELYQKLVNLVEVESKLTAVRAAPWVTATLGTRDTTLIGETARRHAIEARDNALSAVVELERKLNVAVRWLPGSFEWQDAQQLVITRNYQRALDHLEGLVVARMFELTKMNLSQTGYKLRKHIAKALQARSKAIRTALQRYKACAAVLNPPRPPITWDEVVEYAFLADFDLLRSARQDIRSKPWATPAGRLAMDTYFKIQRAQEEIVRLNVEVRRLATYLHDEAAIHAADETAISAVDPHLAHQVRLYRMERGRFHEHLTQRLHDIAGLRSFTGSIEPGTRIARSSATASSFIPVPVPAADFPTTHLPAVPLPTRPPTPMPTRPPMPPMPTPQTPMPPMPTPQTPMPPRPLPPTPAPPTPLPLHPTLHTPPLHPHVGPSKSNAGSAPLYPGPYIISLEQEDQEADEEQADEEQVEELGFEFFHILDMSADI
ncbi:hypothetical protein FA95DRAFT_1567791 [Auriscalpium vulgare]|uniref:Uncharacterized protein n=1 Tax=Auriscalpium vulgare TaxID=40419 RepID=A0ACB8R480_9AGAM|nr:hypothetical protein FA95DRAFT_1567791 [Auriscalpium vulgare]